MLPMPRDPDPIDMGLGPWPSSEGPVVVGKGRMVPDPTPETPLDDAVSERYMRDREQLRSVAVVGAFKVDKRVTARREPRHDVKHS